MNKTHVTVQEAAEMLGHDDSHVRRLLIDGKLKGEKFGGKVWMIKRRVVEKFIEDK